MTVVFLRKILQRIVNHIAMVFLEDFPVHLAAEQLATLMFQRESPGFSTPVGACASVALPPPIPILIIAFPDFFRHNSLPSR